jgi:hypothetical protein
MAGRCVAAAAGVLLVLWAWVSVTGTLIVTRSVAGSLTRWVDLTVNSVFRLVTTRIGDYRKRDPLLATQAAAILLAQLAAWLLLAFLGYTLLIWPFASRGIGSAFTDAGSSMFTLGFAEPAGVAPSAIVFAGAATGLVIVALQIGYLPTLYAAFNRRETEVALLNARAGVPSWGPELLSRTHYALGSGVSTLDTMPDLYIQWERWAADVAESHTTYLPLVRFRSPRPLSSWVTALLAVLDSAALFLALAPKAAPEVQARLCLRGGFQCLNRVARAMGFDLPDEADPEAGITITYEDFLDAITRMREVDFPIERDPAEAWPEFVGWRLNYERAAYAIAAAVDAPPALWSGPRRVPTPAIPPIRPRLGRMPKLGSLPLESGAVDITQLILDDHHEQRRLFAILEQIDRGDIETLTAVWERLAAFLELHAAAEEAIFYPVLLQVGLAARRKAGVEEETLDAIRDHNEIRDAVSDVARHPVGSDGWFAAVAAANLANSDHMAEEEREGLTDFRRLASLQRRHELAVAFAAYEARNYAGVTPEDKDPARYVQEQEGALPSDGSLSIGDLKGR